MPRKIIVLVMLLVMLTFKPVCGFAQEKSVIKVGLLPIIESLPLAISATQAEVVNSNFSVEIEVFSTWTALEAAYRTGMVDTVAMTASKALKMASHNVPVRILMGLHKNGNMLVTNFNHISADSFKGKMIGVSGNDTGQLLLLAEFIKDLGMELGPDVRYIAIPQSKALELLRSGRIDGFLLSEPYGTMAIDEGLVKKAVPGVSIKRDFVDLVLIASPKTIKSHFKEIKHLVAAIKQAGKIIKNDVEKSGGKQVSLTQLDVLGIKPEIVQKALSYSASKIKYDDMRITKEDLKEVEKAGLNLGFLDTSMDLDKIIERKFSR